MTPKVLFKYSWPYDESWKENYKGSTYEYKAYPSAKKIEAYIQIISKLWKQKEKQVLKEIADVTHLSWHTPTITCYVVGRCIPFSDPLTIPVYDQYPDYFIDILTHELIHRLFTDGQNEHKAKEAWKYIHTTYKKEQFNTQIHIPLHAVHKHIYLKYFNESHIQRDQRLIRHLAPYKKSWRIVEKEGYENIIKEFVKRIK